MAVHSGKKTLYAIEAKSGTGTTLSVPSDQILRCMSWTRIFKLYKNSTVVLAFKFLSKKRLGHGEYTGRQLREFFMQWDPELKPVNCVCTYDGQTYCLEGGRRHTLSLKEHRMPFHI